MKKKSIIGIVDTGTSNIKSVIYALKECKVEVLEIKDVNETLKIDAMVVPGIGSFKFVMKNLREKKLDKLIKDKIQKEIPSLFICVGMKILFTKCNEFGNTNGLGIFKGEVKKINTDEKKKRNVPFIGWNKITKKKNCPILDGLSDNDFFYYTHSYYVDPEDKDVISTTTNYKDFTYCSSVSKNSIFATQFHPEKSGVSGLKIYKNFIRLIEKK